MSCALKKKGFCGKKSLRSFVLRRYDVSSNVMFDMDLVRKNDLFHMQTYPHGFGKHMTIKNTMSYFA